MLWTLLWRATIPVFLWFWWWYKRPQTVLRKLNFTAACLLAGWSIGRDISDPIARCVIEFCQRTWVFLLQLDGQALQRSNMLVTFAAFLWLLHRAWQTLWKPVPELINILGVEVPEPPDVSLAGIKADAATLSWTRPSSNHPVQKFIIQVNGVNVGESSPQEIAITVTGLKPNHFYNIRVIAVGPNNFQSGSQLIRLRTFGRDGRPELGNSRIPDSFLAHEQHRLEHGDNVDDDCPPRSPVPSIEAAPAVDQAVTMTREAPSTTTTQRRNTLNRRHSPSVATAEPPPIKHTTSGEPEPSLQELNDKFERIRKETEDTLGQYAREENEFKMLEEDLKREKDRKKQMQKEKDDNTEQLKKRVTITYNQMRVAEKEKAKKEKLLSDKEAKRSNLHESIKKWNVDIENMRKKRDGFEAEKLALEKERDAKLTSLDEDNAILRDEYSSLEKELKDKRDQLKALEAARKGLPGGEEDDKWKENNRDARKKWDMKRRELSAQILAEGRRAQQLDNHTQVLIAQLHAQQQAGLQFYSQANSSGVDFDQSTPAQLKRRSRNSNSMSGVVMSSPTSAFSTVDSSFPPSTTFNVRSSFVPGPFMDMSAADASGMNQSFNEAELRLLTAGAPLSPTATALLPSGILGDDEPPSPTSKVRQSPFGPTGPPPDTDPQSPASSSRSLSILSSPHSSSHNLAFAQYAGDSSDRLSLKAARGELGASGSPSGSTDQVSGHRLTNIWSSFHRNRGAKALEEGGPPIGSLKSGQSRSFPRQTDDSEMAGKRKIGFSAGWFNRNSTGPELEGGAPVAVRGLSARRLIPFGGLNAAGNPLFTERDPSSPRPASIASSDLPRQSTDSSSIWNAPIDTSNLGKSRLWPTHDGLWSSRNPSRRPSLHGSPSALKTTLASADDEILDEQDLLNPEVSPSQVGVIGSRPPAPSKSLSQRLNPAAPTFMAGLFRPKTEKDKEKESGKENKSKTRDKDKSKDGRRDKKGKEAKEATTPNLETPQSLSMDDSPSDSRKSRDAFSVHTQTSVSESRESLSLDRTVSNTPSEPNAAGSVGNLKGEENVVRKLFRKGSSSKFSASLRLGIKKGPGSSTTNSDKNASADRSSIGDLDDPLGDEAGPLGRNYDSVTSSPSLGPARSRDGKGEGRMSNWRFSMKKKGKDMAKESLDLDRDKAELESDEKTT